ncbi:MAG: hypothetical protein COB49_06150 [Alphaproteobacteria bacterium]|nr:MAG: hypothetical protein COB49_06150 [Alphaproteobacteria bacterium]
MFNKLFLSVLAMVVSFAVPAAQAATRTNAPLEMTRIEDPISEKECLQAFVESDFIYAHSLCLSLAQQGMRDAQLVTGLMYVLGEGTEKNAELAELWLKEAVRNGSEEAKEVLVEFKLSD